MNKIKESFINDISNKLRNNDISFSRYVELINEEAKNVYCMNDDISINYTLYYANIDRLYKGESNYVVTFTYFKNICDYINKILANNSYIIDRVIVCEYAGEIYITTDCYLITNFIKTLHSISSNANKKEIFIYEYPSYEESYESALKMRKHDVLCYRKDKKS